MSTTSLPVIIDLTKDDQDISPCSNKGTLNKPLMAESRHFPTFLKTQQRNKEAFAKQGALPRPRNRSILHLVPDSALERIKPEDEDRWVDRFVKGLLATQRNDQIQRTRASKNVSVRSLAIDVSPFVDSPAADNRITATLRRPASCSAARPTVVDRELKLTKDVIDALRKYTDQSRHRIHCPQPRLPLVIRREGELPVGKRVAFNETVSFREIESLDTDELMSESEDEDALFVRSSVDRRQSTKIVSSISDVVSVTKSDRNPGHAIVRPQTAKKQRPASIMVPEDRLLPTSTIQTTVSLTQDNEQSAADSATKALPFSHQVIAVPHGLPTYPNPNPGIIDLDSPPNTPSTPCSPSLQKYAALTNHAIQIHLIAIRAAASNIPAWHKLLPTPKHRRSQLHRWFGLYTTWENDVAFSEEDRREWREGLVALTRDFNSLVEKTPVEKGKGCGVKERVVRGRVRRGISGRIMKKREGWFL